MKRMYIFAAVLLMVAGLCSGCDTKGALDTSEGWVETDVSSGEGTDLSGDVVSTTTATETTISAVATTTTPTTTEALASTTEQGKEAGRSMEEIMQDTIKFSDGKELKVVDLILLEEDIVLTVDGGMLPGSYKNWADRLGVPEEDRITYPTEKYGIVIDCGGTMESILKKNGYTNVEEIQDYLGKLGY